MLKQHSRLVTGMLCLADIAVTIASFFVSHWIRSTYPLWFERGGLYPVAMYFWLLIFIVPLWTILLFRFQSYRSRRTISFVTEMEGLWKTALVGGLILGTIAFGFKSYYLSRTFVVTFVIVNVLALTGERLFLRLFTWAVRRRGYNYRNVIIVGTDDAARQMADTIGKYRKWGLRVLGFVTECRKERIAAVGSYPVLGCVDDLERIIQDAVVDEVIFSVMGKRLEAYEDTFLMLEDHGINARIVANIFPHVIARLRLEELDSVPLLTFTTVPSNTTALAAKRLFDIAVSFALLCCGFPVMAIAAIAVKATSPGPIFFRQQRAGLNGRTFTLYKFRSMFLDAEARRKELEAMNEMEGPVFKIKDDPRITPVGRFIRKASIDELPQLWNVLKGDMSIVGPRPPLPSEVSQYERWQRRRLSMRPGITCLWQVNGRNTVTKFDDWVKMDLEYIDTWSLDLDIRIFLKTIPAVLFRKGAA